VTILRREQGLSVNGETSRAQKLSCDSMLRLHAGAAHRDDGARLSRDLVIHDLLLAISRSRTILCGHRVT
jgi:hypothetical protein